MSQIGVGVFTLGNEYTNSMPCRPNDISLDRIKGMFKDNMKEKVVRWVISFSENHGCWCKVDWYVFLAHAQRRSHGESHFISTFERSTQELIDSGKLRMEVRFRDWRSFLNALWPRRVLPTASLIADILAHQQKR
ncbi:MAG: hypothetical protein NTW11_00300 [Candidatus Staskawiczbacteria bacterium]|nr:hypothetical protein [Candidatus Staskawiczbacteria bacterium]